MSNTNTSSVTISQQALNVIRQLINAQGWAKSVSDIFTGGKMLAEGLPQLDPLDWIKTEKEIIAMSDEERKEYLAKDKAWGEKKIELALSKDEKDIVVRAFKHNIDELIKAGRLGPNPVLFEIVKTFDIKDDEKKDK